MSEPAYAEVKRHFQAVVQLDRGEWAAYLDRECAGQVELRAQVEELLAHHREESVTDIPVEPELPPTRFTKVATGGKRSAGSTEYRKSMRRQRGISIALLVVIAALVAIGWRETRAVEASMRTGLSTVLEKVAGLNAGLLEAWAQSHRRSMQWGRGEEVRTSVEDLMEVWRAQPESDAASEARAHLEQLVRRFTPGEERTGFYVISWDGILVDAPREMDFMIGKRRSPLAAKFLERCALEGPRVKSPSFLSQLVSEWPEGREDPLVVGWAMPIYAPTVDFMQLDRGQTHPLAFLVFTGSVSDAFWKPARTLQIGKSAEVYAFDERGRMLSQSRYADVAGDPVQALVGGATNKTTLHLTLLDPGRDLTVEAPAPGETFGGNALTRPVRGALATNTADAARGAFHAGLESESYRSYRGVESLSAWVWLDELDIGVVVEVNESQALAGLGTLRLISGLYFLLLGLLAIGALYSSFSAVSLYARIEGGNKLGQYTLLRLIGEGGLGQVYVARHARLRRPAAVKLIREKAVNEETIQRFEREVQLTCELSHPNTIVIYDYGRSERGTFYYAMELLPGITLARLLEAQGAQPVARVIYILRQLLGSLAEAHTRGMVHRDVKPLNIMLNQRGGESDVVKVLDFGLAKEIEGGDLELTAEGMISGTPLYIAPERMQNSGALDGRSDLYSVGTIAYQLLSGRVPFDGSSRMELLMQVQGSAPPRVSSVEGIEVPRVLDDLILASMAKDPEARPQSAAQMARVLEELQWEHPWSQEQAAFWWRQWEASGDEPA